MCAIDLMFSGCAECRDFPKVLEATFDTTKDCETVLMLPKHYFLNFLNREFVELGTSF